MIRALLLLSFASCSASVAPRCGQFSPEQLRISQLGAFAKAADAEGMACVKLNWEEGWDDAWSLVSAKLGDVEHYTPGVSLEWRKRVGPAEAFRIESFTLDGTLIQALEWEEVEGRMTRGGQVGLTADGRQRYRTERSEGSPQLPQLLTYSDGKLRSVYRSTNPEEFFMLSGGDLFSVPADFTLVSGVEDPDVEALRPPAKDP